MRILFVITGLGAGGAEKNVAMLARHRAEKGDVVTVLAFAGAAGESYFPYPEGVSVETLGQSTKEGRGRRKVLNRLIWLRARIGALKPDLVISFLTKNNVLSLLATLGRGIPVVIAERNNPEVQPASALWRLGLRWLGPQAARIVMLTGAGLSRLPAALRSRAVVIPNPATVPADVTPCPGDGGRLVAVGRLDGQKGFDLLIAAFAATARAHPAATLTIFGEGPGRAALEEQAKACGIGDRVALPGVTGRAGAWIAQADIFALSSRYEGFPNALAEAAAAGLPCAAFDCPFGPRDILAGGAAGLLVPGGDVEALAGALRRLLADPDLRSRLGAAASEASARFSMAAILDQWDATIAACGSGGPP